MSEFRKVPYGDFGVQVQFFGWCTEKTPRVCKIPQKEKILIFCCLQAEKSHDWYFQGVQVQGLEGRQDGQASSERCQGFTLCRSGGSSWRMRSCLLVGLVVYSGAGSGSGPGSLANGTSLGWLWGAVLQITITWIESCWKYFAMSLWAENRFSLHQLFNP